MVLAAAARGNVNKECSHAGCHLSSGMGPSAQPFRQVCF